MLTLPRVAFLWIVSCTGFIFIPRIVVQYSMEYGYIIITIFFSIAYISVYIASYVNIFIIRQQKYLIITALRDSLLLCIMFTSLCYYIDLFLQRAESISPTTVHTMLSITHIQRQLGYTTLIANIDVNNKKIRAYLNWPIEEQPQYGQQWYVKIKLKPLNGRINEGGFDRQKWLISQHVLATGRVIQGDLISTQQSFREKILYRSLEQLKDLSARGLIIALAFGERAWIEPNQWQNFQKSGTSHLLAISGLHFALVLLVSFYFVRACQYFLKTEMITYKLPIIISLLVGAYYAYWANFSLPTQRAFFSIALFYLFKISRKHFRQRDTIVMIMAILLLLDPLAVLSQSFWLSCSTIICLALYYTIYPLSGIEINSQSILDMGIIRRTIYSLIHLQVGVTLCLTPIMLYMFHGGNYLSLLINLFVVPLFMCLLLPIIMMLLTADAAMMLLGF